MLSVRARHYLEHLERRPHVADLAVVRDALAAAGVPATDPLLAFHATFAGFVTPRPDEVVWGLVHAAPVWVSVLAVEAFAEDGTHYVVCADAHPSYDLRLDQHGAHYTTCTVPRTESFARMIEQDAFLAEACRGRAWVGRNLELCNDPDELREVVLPRFAAHRIPELSDAHSAVYATAEVVLEHLVHHDAYRVTVLGGAQPVELAGVRWDPGARRTWAELRADLDSPYRGRRYQAMYDLRETTEPEAAPLFRAALADRDARVLSSALDGVRRLGARDALPDVLALVTADGPLGVVSAAIHAASELGGVAAQHAIARATCHADTLVRRTAVHALAAHGDAEVIADLERLLGDPAVPMAGPRGDKRSIGDEARAAIAAIRARGG